MKISTHFLQPILILLTSLCYSVADDATIRSEIGPAFGQVVSLEIEFIDKENTYFEQNIVKSPWMAKVLAVAGRRLTEPLIMEYRSRENQFKKGRVYQLQGYEDIYSLGVSKAWDQYTQVDYNIRHRLILRSPVSPHR